MSVLDSVIIIIIINLSIYLNLKHVDINEQVHLFTVLKELEVAVVMYSAVVRLLQRGNQSPVTSGQETGDHQGGTTGHWALELSTDLREVSQLKAYQPKIKKI